MPLFHVDQLIGKEPTSNQNRHLKDYFCRLIQGKPCGNLRVIFQNKKLNDYFVHNVWQRTSIHNIGIFENCKFEIEEGERLTNGKSTVYLA